MAFKPNRAFKRKYQKIFKQDPQAANLFLLLAELTDTKGQIITNEEELAQLFEARFSDPSEYGLGDDND